MKQSNYVVKIILLLFAGILVVTIIRQIDIGNCTRDHITFRLENT